MEPFEESEDAYQNRRYLLVVGGIASVVLFVGVGACVFILTMLFSSGEGMFAESSDETSESVEIIASEPTAEPVDIAQNLLLAENLPGLYAIEGSNPNGGTYQGTLEIARPGEYYTVEWNIADEVITGTGLLQDNIFSVSWGGQLCVAQYYKVYEDGSLDGVWFWIRNPEELGTEYVEPLDDGSENLLVGVHDMSGVNPDGGEYNGTAEIAVNGSVYSITWYVSDEALPAIGVRQGDVISVGWGGDSCNVASYIVNEDGTLSGIWTNVGEALLGTEVGEKVGR